ncbi:outer membrane efflux protein [Salinisphaera sp. PC39]|uniref:TolC family protein n=1 Tax=Salinisphaera sp. PC39 TaxID=1304156 RepID=UPI003342A604
MFPTPRRRVPPATPHTNARHRAPRPPAIRRAALAGACLLALAAVPPWAAAGDADAPLTLDRAIRLADEHDPWLDGSRERERALAEEAVAAGELPDPRVDLTAANLPTDSFDLDQEPMTQLSIGVSQAFPRGDSREIASRRKRELAARQPLLRADRRAEAAAVVSRLWLEVYRTQRSIDLIEADRALFRHLVDAAEAKYAAALAHTRQQDVIRAQLELSRLDERLAALAQQRDAARGRLAEWIGGAAHAPLPETLPDLAPAAPALVGADTPPSRQQWYERVREHPAVRAADRDVAAARSDVDLARQKYKPEWGLSARYGYREDDPAGRDRADLFSVGLTFDLPIFTGDRQDREVAAAAHRAEASAADRELLVRRLVAGLEEARAELARLDQRRRLYERRLLPQLREQAEAALAAYNNDDGDFAEAVRARIDVLDTRIEALAIRVARLQTVARLNYLLARAPAAGADEGSQP